MVALVILNLADHYKFYSDIRPWNTDCIFRNGSSSIINNVIQNKTQHTGDYDNFSRYDPGVNIF